MHGFQAMACGAGRLTALLLGLSGCYTQAEGAQLRDELRQQTYELREAQVQLKAVQDELALVSGKLATLEQTATSASQASADLVADMSNLQTRAMELQGKLESLEQVTEESQKKQVALEQKMSSASSTAQTSPAPSDIVVPEGADAIHEEAQTRHANREYHAAQQLFRVFVAQHPKDPRAGRAQYQIGKIDMERGRPASALGEFRRVTQHYLQSDAADDALLEMGRAFFQLQACSDARAAFETLIRQFKDSPLVATAQEELKTVRKAPAGRCTQ